MSFLLLLLFIFNILTIVHANPLYFLSFDIIKNNITISNYPNNNSNHDLINLEIYYKDTIELNGWSSLRINKRSDNISIDHSKLWFTAGYGEGYLTQRRTWQNWVNTMNPEGKKKYEYLDHKVAHWISEHIHWILDNAKIQKEKDQFWKNVNYIMHQLEGFTEGYNSVALQEEKLTFFDMFAFNFQNEIGSVMRSIGYSERQVKKTSFKKGGCGALIKPTKEDLFMSHTTWGTYSSMLRTYKDYNFSDARIAFSGYPGLLSSTDDWYMMGNGLTIQETTMQNSNNKLRKFVIPTSVSEWIRVMVACQLGQNGLNWGDVFKRYNSGTYNNQYMVVNMNLFVPGKKLKDLPDNLVWIVSQMPGLAPSLDVTHVIRDQGYWASYNLNYLPVLYIASETNILEEQYGSYFSYTKYSRAELFKKYAPYVKNIKDMKTIMRYNRWQTDDQYSKCPNCKPSTNPMLSIAARGDLIPKNGTWGNWTWLKGPQAFGAVDSKITSYKMLKKDFSAHIISGPTYDDQIPFRWSTSPVRFLPLSQSSHIGQPDLQMFEWVDTKELFE
jgi:Phospholipase B